MTHLDLVWAGLLRHKARTILTLLSILVAFMLFGLLDTVRTTFNNTGKTIKEFLVVNAKLGFGAKPLPRSLLPRIKEIPGVVWVDYGSYVQGTYQDPKNSIVVEAHPHSWYESSPEIQVAAADREALQRTRTGVLVGEILAKKYGFKVGDKIPLETQQLRKDGTTVWTFDVVGILRFIDQSEKFNEEMAFANWDYVEEARVADIGTVTYYEVQVANSSQIDRVARQIDALTANSDHETKTQSENEWAFEQLQQFGNIGVVVTSIMGAVCFTLLLLTSHTMTHAVHERISEFAILKTLGFTGRKILTLVLLESVALVVLGGIIGLAVTTVAVIGVRSAAVLPIRMLPVGGDTWMRGLILAAAIGICVGLFPALRGMRLRIVDGLSGH